MRFDRLILFHLLWLLPVAFWPGSNSYDAIKFTVLAWACALWLGQAAWQGWQGRLNFNVGMQGLINSGILALIIGGGVFTASNPALVIRTGLLVLLFMMVMYKTTELHGGLPCQNHLLAAVATSAALAGLYGLLQMANLVQGAPASSGYPPGISSLGNQNYLAGFMAISLWPAVILLRQASRQWSRVLTIVALLIIILTLVFGRAAGPVAGILTAGILVFPCIAFVMNGHAGKVPLLLGGLIFILGGTGLGMMWDAASALQEPEPTSQTSMPLHHTLLASNHGDIRISDWLTALTLIQNSPGPVGIGAGNFLVQWPAARATLDSQDAGKFMPWGTPISTRAHNDLLQWGAETGPAGLIWLGLTIMIGAWNWQRRFLALQRNLQINYLLLTGAILTVAVHSMVSFPFHLPATSLVFVFLLGLIFPKESVSKHLTNRPLSKVFGLLLAISAVLLLVGSTQEFRGDLLTALGSKHYTHGNMQTAKDHLEKGIQLMKWPDHGHLYLGLANSALGNNDPAGKNFTMSINDRPSFEAHLALAEIAINRSDFQQAENHLALVRACRPQIKFYHQAGYLKGLMFLRQGKQNAARKEFAELIKEDPKRHRALLGLGYLEVLQGHPEQARQWYSQCLKVIDEKIFKYQTQPNQESTVPMVGLQQNRLVAIKALESLGPPLN